MAVLIRSATKRSPRPGRKPRQRRGFYPTIACWCCAGAYCALVLRSVLRDFWKRLPKSSAMPLAPGAFTLAACLTEL